MELAEFTPENELEKIIARAMSGEALLDHVLDALLRSQIFIPSRAEVRQDGSGLVPLIYQIAPESPQLVAIFTSWSRPRIYIEIAKYVVQMKGSEFVRRLAPDTGLVVNLGYKAQLAINPDIVDELKSTLP